ncbi:MAG: acyltransferase [Pirellulales bacterium]|nr:acyltransferase [Pirellulales bacterium]
MSADAGRRQLRALTGVRYLAAAHVMVFHIVVLWVIVAPQSAAGGKLFQPWCAEGVAFFDRFWPLRGIALSGFVSVGLFFVLSGFILSYTSMDADNRAAVNRRQFWANRFARIYPVYLLGLVFNLPLFLVWLAGLKPPLASGAAVGVAASAIGLVQSWWPLASAAWNPPGWSLSVEAFFYFVFPWLILLVDRLPRRALLPSLAVAWGATLVAPLCYLALGGKVDWESESETWLRFVEFNPILRLPEFFAGMVLGKLFVNRQERRGDAPGGGAALSIVATIGLAGVLAYSEQFNRLLLYNGLLLPLFLLLIYGLALEGGPIAWILSGRLFVLLGDASYALYILHHGVIFYGVVWVWLAIGGSAELERQLGKQPATGNAASPTVVEDGDEPGSAGQSGSVTDFSKPGGETIEPNEHPPTPLGFLVGLVALTTVASIAVFKFFEVPCRKFLRRTLGGRRSAREPEQMAQLP